MTDTQTDQHRGLFRPPNRAMAKPDMQVRAVYDRSMRCDVLYFGAEIPVIGTITRKTIPERRYGRGGGFPAYDAFWLDISHAGTDEAHRKAGFVHAHPTYHPTARPQGGEIGKKRIERKKIRELLGADVVDKLPRGFKVGQKIPFTAWADLWTVPPWGGPWMTIEKDDLEGTVIDSYGQMSAKQWWHAKDKTPGFLNVRRGPAAGLTLEYTADELNKALQPGFRQMKQMQRS